MAVNSFFFGFLTFSPGKYNFSISLSSISTSRSSNVVKHIFSDSLFINSYNTLLLSSLDKSEYFIFSSKLNGFKQKLFDLFFTLELLVLHKYILLNFVSLNI